MTDKELIDGCIREDRHFQKMLVQRFAGKMMTVCRRYARHQMEAEDMVQETFIKVFDNITSFGFKGSFEGWIRRIAVNIALKKVKKFSFQNEKIGMEKLPEISLDPAVLAQLHEEEILKLIAGLPEGYRLVFNLYVIEGFSHREIAKNLNIEESTSRSQLLKARKMLQVRIIQMQKVSA